MAKLIQLDGSNRKPCGVSQPRRPPLQSNTSENLQFIVDQYWSWHFDSSVTDAARLLLATNLGWNETNQLSVPLGALTSPLGTALSHSNPDIRDAALTVFDSQVKIPAGTVLIGEDLNSVFVDAFKIGRYPVTNAQYKRFIDATGHRDPYSWEDNQFLPNTGDHPVIWVSSEDAEVYADWVGGRLPSFEEWERAARGDDDRLFTWGDKIDKPRCNTAEAGARTTTPVGTFPEGISQFGCYDLLGNVWEWTSTWYDENQHFRVVRGGAWYYNHDHATCIGYDLFSKEYTEFVIGFRVCF